MMNTDNALQEAVNQWQSKELMNIWLICGMPDFDEDGNVYLCESAIKDIMVLVVRAEKEMRELAATRPA